MKKVGIILTFLMFLFILNSCEEEEFTLTVKDYKINPATLFEVENGSVNIISFNTSINPVITWYDKNGKLIGSGMKVSGVYGYVHMYAGFDKYVCEMDFNVPCASFEESILGNWHTFYNNGNGDITENVLFTYDTFNWEIIKEDGTVYHFNGTFKSNYHLLTLYNGSGQVIGKYDVYWKKDERMYFMNNDGTVYKVYWKQ